MILALAPIASAGLADPGQIVVADSKSGVTRAGRSAALATSFCEVGDNFRSYKTVGHRHTPEMIQELEALSGGPFKLAFTPHLLPMNRGILTTVYARLARPESLSDLHARYVEYYRGDRFVRVGPLGRSPETADVRGTNFCDLALFHDPDSGLHKIVSVIDNLCRGAAGQAVANLNLMTGRPEGLGLELAPVRP